MSLFLWTEIFRLYSFVISY